tara:strand:- start:244 stop:675 length:432 start_codon:yes stop_codon:yes gene_type:complete
MNRYVVVKRNKGYWVVHDRYYHFLIDDIYCNPKTCEKLHTIAGDTNYKRIVKFANMLEKYKYFTISELRKCNGLNELEESHGGKIDHCQFSSTPYERESEDMYLSARQDTYDDRKVKMILENKCWVFPSEKNKELFDQLHPEL